MRTFTLVAAILAAQPGHASELVYTPVNPAFGGNPINGSYLLSNAGAQNDFKDPDAPEYGDTSMSAIERFTSSLESRLLSELLTNVSNGETGSMVTNDFIIEIVDNAGVLQIAITDKHTGEKTYIEVNGLISSSP